MIKFPVVASMLQVVVHAAVQLIRCRSCFGDKDESSNRGQCECESFHDFLLVVGCQTLRFELARIKAQPMPVFYNSPSRGFTETTYEYLSILQRRKSAITMTTTRIQIDDTPRL